MCGLYRRYEMLYVQTLFGVLARKYSVKDKNKFLYEMSKDQIDDAI